MRNNYKPHNHLMNACLAAVLALGLAACSSSDGDGDGDMSQMPTTTTPEPMEPTPVDVAIPETPMGYAAEAGTLTIPAGGSATSGGVMFSCAAGGDACVVTIADDGTATATGGDVTAALTAEAQMAADDAATSAALMARDRIIGIDRAIEAAANLPATATANMPAESNIIISRGAGADALVIVDSPAGFTASDTAALSNGDWAGTRLMRAGTGTAAGTTQHLVVYTDIELPTRVQFYDYDGDDDTDPWQTTRPTDDELDIHGATLFTGANLDSSKFDSPGSPEDGDIEQEFPVPAGEMVTSFQGNFNGAPGTYSCDSGTADQACVVTISPSGTYSTDDDWTFTPELNSTAWQQDAEFISFGWWLQEPDSANGTYTFRYYADGTDYASADNDGIVAGTATYSGRAAGQYVVQTIEDSGVTGGTSGQFTAAATLNAAFGPAASTISGSISGFQGEDGALGWAVTLHEKTLGAQTALNAAFPDNAQTDPTADDYAGVTATLGSHSAFGDWDGQFFGTADEANAYPLGVGGTFQADSEAASIAGAYGARR